MLGETRGDYFDEPAEFLLDASFRSRFVSRHVVHEAARHHCRVCLAGVQMRIMTSFISEQALPLPAVIPRNATTSCETTA